MSDFKVASGSSHTSPVPVSAEPLQEEPGWFTSIASWLTWGQEATVPAFQATVGGSDSNSEGSSFEVVKSEEDEDGVVALEGSHAESPQTVPESLNDKTQSIVVNVLQPVLVVPQQRQKLQEALAVLELKILKTKHLLTEKTKRHATQVERRNELQKQIRTASTTEKNATKQAERKLLWGSMSLLADQMQKLQTQLNQMETEKIKIEKDIIFLA